MTRSSSENRSPPPTHNLRRGTRSPSRADPQGLVVGAIDEMMRAWRRGERPTAEDFLARHPELMCQPELAAELIYEEVCLRQEYGDPVPPGEILRRYPQWREKLEILLDCQRLLGVSAPVMPRAGAVLGDFTLLGELGRGAHATVFLATQQSLGDRPVVLKLIPFEEQEHLSLARLQHTFIVPLLSVHDFATHGWRALCMPYFGGASLTHFLTAMRQRSPAQRTGKDFIEAMATLQSAAAFALPGRGPALESLAQNTYTRAVCRLGECLAHALQYAHDRGILHLDVKPSNVLLTADGLPMLLDFHVARPPLEPGQPPPCLFGGTPDYMSPEQDAALSALERRRAIPHPIDARSDIYSLGVLLHESLTGTIPEPGARLRMRHANPEVSPGLEDIVRTCLAHEPKQRYRSMDALAEDLRRHLRDLPLLGVRNRSLGERWQKWRRRRPNGLAAVGMLAAILGAGIALAVGMGNYVSSRTDQARERLLVGQTEMAEGRQGEASSTFREGLALLRGIPFQNTLSAELRRYLQAAEDARIEAEQRRTVETLHSLADQLRFLHDGVAGSNDDVRRLDSACAALWDRRTAILERIQASGDAESLRQAREDLLDLGLFRAARLDSASTGKSHDSALTVLDQAETAFGADPVLDEERRRYSGVPANELRRAGGEKPSTVWGHYALGRSLLRAGESARAAKELEAALRAQPYGLWPNFYHGVCVYRLGRHEEAVTAFSVCIGAAPNAAACYYNRAMAHEALGRNAFALSDYGHALRLDPHFAAAALNRGMLHFRAGRHDSAVADLRSALDLGADPALVFYDLALVELERADPSAAVTALERVLERRPDHQEARALLRQLRP